MNKSVASPNIKHTEFAEQGDYEAFHTTPRANKYLVSESEEEPDPRFKIAQQPGVTRGQHIERESIKPIRPPPVALQESRNNVKIPKRKNGRMPPAAARKDVPKPHATDDGENDHDEVRKRSRSQSKSEFVHETTGEEKNRHQRRTNGSRSDGLIHVCGITLIILLLCALGYIVWDAFSRIYGQPPPPPKNPGWLW